MDNGRGIPANPTMDFSPDSPDSQMRDTARSEAYQLGAPMRRLEADMGLPSGYLEIHERPGQRQQYLPTPERPDRAPPAPYYQQQEPRPNPRPGTIPILPDGRQQPYFDPRDRSMDQRPYVDLRQQEYADPRYQQEQRYRQQYIDERYQQQYYDPRHQQYIDPRYSRQYMDPRFQQRQYQDTPYRKQQFDLDPRSVQQFMDPRFLQQLVQSGVDPRMIQRRMMDPRYQQQYYDQRYQQQYYDEQTDNTYRQQWWDQSSYPSDQRYTPGRNPVLDNYRQQWWRNAQTPPGYGDDMMPTQRTYRYDNPNQYPQQYQGDQVWQNLAYALRSLLGHSVNEFDQSVPPRLGCARAVSLLLERAYGLPIRDQGCEGLEQTIQNYGWVQVDPRQIQPGDVIVAHRQPGDYGHSAVYVGNDQVYNNNSNTGLMQLDSASKFRSREFLRVNVYRKMR